MTSLTECEKRVIRKLTMILNKALNCHSGATTGPSKVSILEKLLGILLTDDEITVVGNDGIDLILQGDDYTTTSETSTSITSFSGILNSGSGETTSSDKSESTGMSRLHKLEVIKVVVLIFVVSIILLSICEMLFQLFARFRPKESPEA
ncbi:unnamed protein product [Orchesella dallaii]|uniref:Uncharacterized protein n=1 Tax=Orchesella dallaii TaxID=48710 RepID=A0ABP1Q0D6_9HEXA